MSSSPSWIIPSINAPSFMRYPQRAPGSRKGAMLMTPSLRPPGCPHPRFDDLSGHHDRLEARGADLLMVVAGTSLGIRNGLPPAGPGSALSGGEHVPQDDFFHLFRLDLGSFDGFLNGISFPAPQREYPAAYPRRYPRRWRTALAMTTSLIFSSVFYSLIFHRRERRGRRDMKFKKNKSSYPEISASSASSGGSKVPA